MNCFFSAHENSDNNEYMNDPFPQSVHSGSKYNFYPVPFIIILLGPCLGVMAFFFIHRGACVFVNNRQVKVIYLVIFFQSFSHIQLGTDIVLVSSV